MNIDSNLLTNIVIVIVKFSLAVACLLHALFVLYVARQVMNMRGLLSTIRWVPLVSFAVIHAIISLALLLYICFLPQF